MEQPINEQENLRRRLTRAETSHRKEQELYDRMMETGFALEELLNETVAENKKLIERMKELQQKLADLKKKRETEDEADEAQRQQLLLEEEQRKIVNNQLIYMRKMEKEIEKLSEQNDNLTAEMDQFSLGKKYKDHLEKMSTTEQELQHKLEKIKEALGGKDDEIKKKFMTLVQNLNEVEEHLNNVETLRQEQQELREQLRRTQEEQILLLLATQSSPQELISENRQPEDISLTEENDKDKQDAKTGSWWRHCAMGLWEGVKIAGLITLVVPISVGFMVWMSPACNNPDPDCNCRNMLLDWLDYFHQSEYTNPVPY